MHHRRRPHRRPQSRAIIGIVRNLHPSPHRGIDRREHRIARRRRNPLTDPRHIQHPRRRDRLHRHIRDRKHRRRRVRPIVQEMMPTRIMRNEINPGLVTIRPQHAPRIHALALPQPHEAVAGHVHAQRGDIANPSALPRRRDGRVGGVATVPFQIMLGPISTSRQLVELQHRLAHAQQVDAHNTAFAAASIATRSPAAMRFSSTSAPPMPTNAAPAAR